MSAIRVLSDWAALALLAVLGLIGGFSHDARGETSIWAHHYAQMAAMHEQIEWNCRVYNVGYMKPNHTGRVARFKEW